MGKLINSAGSFDQIYPSVDNAKRKSDLNRHFRRRMLSTRFIKAMQQLKKQQEARRRRLDVA